MKVAFLDRDGVINKYPGDLEYVKSWDEFSFLPGSKSALSRLSQRGFEIFVVSNQAGVSKGIFTQDTLDLITQNMLAELIKDGIRIAGVYYCTHAREQECSCRKPKTGLLEKGVNKLKEQGLDIDRKRSYFIGDTVTDMQAGHLAGLNTVLVFSGKEKPENKDHWQPPPDFTASDLSAAVDLILK